MKNILPLLSILIFMSNVFSQSTFIKYYTVASQPDFWISDFKQTADSGFIAYGSIYNNSDNRLIRFDKDANVLWAKSTHDIVSGTFTGDVLPTSDGGYLTASILAMNLSRGLLLHKFDSIGNLMMQKKIPFKFNSVWVGFNENVHAIFTQSRNLVLSFMAPDSLNRNHATVCMLDSNLNVIWTKFFGTNLYDESHGSLIVETTDNSLLLSATIIDTTTFNHKLQFFKMDMAGNVIWSRVIDFANDAEVNCLAKSKNGDYIIAAKVSSDIAIGRIDNNGVFRCLKVFDSGPNEGSPRLIESSNGNINLVFSNYSTPFFSGVFIQTDSLGNLLTSFEIGNYHSFSSITKSFDGSLYMSGTLNDTIGFGFFGAFLLKSDSNGFVGCMETAASLNSFQYSFQVDSGFIDSSITTLALHDSIINSSSPVLEQVFCMNVDIPADPEIGKIFVFPSPSSDHINISFGNFQLQKFRILLIDALGRVNELSKLALSEQGVRADISDKSNGIYWLRIESAGKFYTSKIVIAR